MYEKQESAMEENIENLLQQIRKHQIEKDKLNQQFDILQQENKQLTQEITSLSQEIYQINQKYDLTSQHLETYQKHIYSGNMSQFIIPDDSGVQQVIQNLDLPPRTTGAEAISNDQKVFEWVQQNIKYSWDLFPIGQGWLVKYPNETIVSKSGNCFEQATLLASLLIPSGESPAYVRVVEGKVDCLFFDCSSGDKHAWTELIISDNDENIWLPIDPVSKSTPFYFWRYLPYPAKSRDRCFNQTQQIEC